MRYKDSGFDMDGGRDAMSELDHNALVAALEERSQSQEYRKPHTPRVQQAPPLVVEPASQQGPDYSTWGQYGHAPLDEAKLAAGHDSPKYQIARVLSHFDPKQGITDEVLAALNTRGLGTFTGGGDKLYVGGDADSRFGDVRSSDVVTGFKSGNGTWGSWGSPVGAGGGAPSPMGQALAANGSLLVPGDNMSTYEAIVRRLQGITGVPQALDQEALLRLLG